MGHYSLQSSEEGDWEGSNDGEQSHLKEWGAWWSWGSVTWGSVTWGASVAGCVTVRGRSNHANRCGHNVSLDEGRTASNVIGPVVSGIACRVTSPSSVDQRWSKVLNGGLVTAGSVLAGAVRGYIARCNSDVRCQCGTSNWPGGVWDVVLSNNWVGCAHLVNSGGGISRNSVNLSAASVRSCSLASSVSSAGSGLGSNYLEKSIEFEEVRGWNSGECNNGESDLEHSFLSEDFNLLFIKRLVRFQFIRLIRSY